MGRARHERNDGSDPLLDCKNGPGRDEPPAESEKRSSFPNFARHQLEAMAPVALERGGRDGWVAKVPATAIPQWPTRSRSA